MMKGGCPQEGSSYERIFVVLSACKVPGSLDLANLCLKKKIKTFSVWQISLLLHKKWAKIL